jgi:hypothetical protein
VQAVGDFMNTIFYVGGISCAGKSTRVLALVSYLNSIKIKREEFKFTDRYGKTKTIGFLYDSKLLIIGKLIVRNNSFAWQGVDAFSNFLQEDLGQPNLYAHIFEWSKKYSVVLDASLMLRSPWSRPYSTSKNTDADSVTFMFCANSIEEYAQRLALRSERKVTEESGMWKSNSSFRVHIKHHEEELERCGLSEDKYKAYLCSINDNVNIIGVTVLLRVFPELAEGFLDFCVTYKEELHNVGVIK